MPVYELWMLPANSNSLKDTYSLAKGQPPLFVGVVNPTVGSDGLIRAEGNLPAQVNGPYLMVITAERSASAHRLGHIVLGGFISL